MMTHQQHGNALPYRTLNERYNEPAQYWTLWSDTLNKHIGMVCEDEDGWLEDPCWDDHCSPHMHLPGDVMGAVELANRFGYEGVTDWRQVPTGQEITFWDYQIYDCMKDDDD